ncbi:MAG: DEAD/DEAH box helicase, partial [Candidatus Heimdallarchaeaceae archaeon]
MISFTLDDPALTSFQKKCLKAYKQDKDVLVIAPSSAGKTFVTEQYLLEYFQSVYGKFLVSPRRFKVGFILPYKSLAVQEFNHLEALVSHRGIKTLLAVGGVNIEEEDVAESNILIGTYEKVLTLMKKYEVLQKYMRILVIDEFHFLGTDRGKVLEEIILQCKKKDHKTQLILLSSSIANPLEISDWLNVYPIIEKERPVPIDYNVEIASDTIKFIEKIRKNKQVLVFTHSRSDSEFLAEKLALKNKKKNDIEIDEMIKSSLENTQDSRTRKILEQTFFPPQLKEMVKKGIAYHHAGLSDLVRLLIEDLFINGEIDVLISTSTLAAGVNLPADISVFNLKHNRIKTENNMVFQTLGRAGRLGFKDYGQGIVLVRSERMRRRTEDKFFDSSYDNKARPIFHSIESKFGDYDYLLQFYLDRFYYEQQSSSSELVHLHEKIEDTLWYYQKKSKLMRNVVDFELFQSLFSSVDSTLETAEIIEFYRRLDKTNNVKDRKMEIKSIEGLNTAALVANVQEQSKLFQIYLSPSRRSCTCQNKHSNFICKHQRFLLESYPEGQERWLNNYGILDFLVREGFIVRSSGNNINLTYMGKLAASHYIHPYDFLDYLEFCGINKELTITQYLKRFITRDKRIKQEIKANELSSLLAIRLAHDIVQGREIKEICERYNISDSFVD